MKLISNGQKKAIKTVSTEQIKIQITQIVNEKCHEKIGLKQNQKYIINTKTYRHYRNQPEKQKNQKNT